MERDAIDFENGEITALFRRLLIPTLLGTLSISAMTVLDGAIVGHGVGAHGVAAVNIVVPIFLLMSGLGLMIGAGCSVVSSIHLSQQKLKAARLNVTQAILMAAVVVSLLTIVVMIFPEKTVRMLGASDTLLPHVLDYLMWLMPGFVFEMFTFIGLFVIRMDGAPRYAMWCNIIPAVLNAVLDYVFVVPLHMGVKGAGVATSLCMAIGGVIALAYLMMPTHQLHLVMPKWSVKSLRLSLRNVGYQCRIGLSSLLGELSMAVLVFVGNLVFMRYLGDDGVGAFAISCYYTPFFFTVGNSIAQSAQPIISYNYGAKRWSQVVYVRRLLFLTAFVVGLVVSIPFLLTPEWLVAIFVDVQTESAIMAIEGFPYYAVGILFFILNVAFIGYYQSVERVRQATTYVLLRGVVFVTPCFMLLPHLLGVPGMWLAMPVAEMLTFVVIYISFRRGERKNLSLLTEAEKPAK